LKGLLRIAGRLFGRRPAPAFDADGWTTEDLEPLCEPHKFRLHPAEAALYWGMTDPDPVFGWRSEP
jgi:hypothetical protein